MKSIERMYKEREDEYLNVMVKFAKQQNRKITKEICELDLMSDERRKAKMFLRV